MSTQKNDGLGEAAASFEELCDLLSHELSSLFYNKVLVKISAIIDAVFNQFAVLRD